MDEVLPDIMPETPEELLFDEGTDDPDDANEDTIRFFFYNRNYSCHLFTCHPAHLKRQTYVPLSQHRSPGYAPSRQSLHCLMVLSHRSCTEWIDFRALESRLHGNRGIAHIDFPLRLHVCSRPPKVVLMKTGAWVSCLLDFALIPHVSDTIVVQAQAREGGVLILCYIRDERCFNTKGRYLALSHYICVHVFLSDIRCICQY